MSKCFRAGIGPPEFVSQPAPDRRFIDVIAIGKIVESVGAKARRNVGVISGPPRELPGRGGGDPAK